MVLDQQYISIRAAARRKGDRRRVYEEDGDDAWAQYCACTKQEPQTQASDLLEEGTFKVRPGKPGQGPMVLSLHPPLESKILISPGRSPILSSSLRERIWAQILVPMATAPVCVSMRAGCCCSCRKGGPPHMLLRSWTPGDIKEGAESRSSFLHLPTPS